MATATLKVTVYGGKAPEPYEVTLYKDGKQIFHKEYPDSTSIPFNNLSEGLYGLYINGKNPVNADGSSNSSAATKCELSSTDISLMPTSDPNPDIEHGKQYLVEYHFTI
jgi:hypothetical protein